MTPIGKLLNDARKTIQIHTEQLKPHGLNLLGFIALDLLCSDPETDFRLRDVAHELEILNNDARRVITILEDAGLLERQSAANVVYFVPTAKGEDVRNAALRDLTG